MILVIDIGNTNIKFTGITEHVQNADEQAVSGLSDFSVLFEEKLPTEWGKDMEKFLREAGALLGQHGISFLPEQEFQTTEVLNVEQTAANSSAVQADLSSGAVQTAANNNDVRAAANSNDVHAAVCSNVVHNAAASGAVKAVAISSVVPADTPAAVCLAEKICLQPPVVISCRSDSGLSFEGLPAPERVGTDRIADAAWAAARYPLPAMTADLGTATTINVIAPAAAEKEAVGNGEESQERLAVGGTSQGIPGRAAACDRGEITEDEQILLSGLRGIFLGGMIGAGVSTSLRALRTGTAQLPELQPRPVAADQLIGIDTDGCMLSSAIVGTAALIEGLAARVEEQLGSPLTLILTGGNARFVAPWIRRPFINEPFLASKGAAVIALRELSCQGTETAFYNNGKKQ